MISTFANVPLAVEQVIAHILTRQNSPKSWIKKAEILHKKYMTMDTSGSYIKDFPDALAYLALRTPATYAQIYGALSITQENIPSFTPASVLDIGAGPGTAVWASYNLWPTIRAATCIDQNSHSILLGQQITASAKLPIDTNWIQTRIQKGLGMVKGKYDVVILANILNELDPPLRDMIIAAAYKKCTGIMLIVEPGTPHGSTLIESVAENFTMGKLIAPYINNSLIKKDGFWLHFSQKFVRPQFQKIIRQQLRSDTLAPSDTENAKYSFVALGKINPTQNAWGRCVGTTEKQKGFLEVPVLTDNEIATIKVLKRHKKQYLFAKNLRWGQLIVHKEDIYV